MFINKARTFITELGYPFRFIMLKVGLAETQKMLESGNPEKCADESVQNNIGIPILAWVSARWKS